MYFNDLVITEIFRYLLYISAEKVVFLQRFLEGSISKEKLLKNTA